MFGEFAAQVEFRHSAQTRDREQHILDLIADHLAPPPQSCPERLRARAAALRASARRAWPRPIALRPHLVRMGVDEARPALA